MKQPILLFVALFCFLLSDAQITAYRPDGATFSWWTQEWILDEVGTGMVDSLYVDIKMAGQVATVNYRFYLRALPNAQNLNEDNDSLELRTSFEAPDNVIFTGMKMMMNNELRVGRIIERSKADIIYENLVYDPSENIPPKDPGYLSKDGNQYEFRAFPVGADELAYLELRSVIELENANSLTKEALVSLDLFAQAREEIEHIEITFSFSNDFQEAIPTGLNLVWEQDSLGQYHAEASNFDLTSDLNFVLLNTVPHEISYSHAGTLNDKTHLWTLASNDIGEDVSCKYLIVLDIDYNHLPVGADQEVFITEKIEMALEGLSEIMTENDFFRFSTTHEYMLDYYDDWEPYTSSQFESVSYWGLNRMGYKADIVAAATHAQSITQNENAHTIILTNDFFEADEHSHADLKALAENVLSHNSQTHTDIYSLNQSPNAEVLWVGKRKFSVYQTFFKEYTSQLNGVYEPIVGQSNVGIKKTMQKSALTLEQITTDVMPSAQNYFRVNEYGQLSLYSSDDYQQSPTQLSFSYSNGQKFDLSLSTPYASEVDTALRNLMGTARMFTALHSSEKNSFVSRDYEQISLEYGLVTDYSALLVVEHDSQYHDTNSLFSDWPQPLSTQELVHNETVTQIEVYPNPTTGKFIVKGSMGIRSIRLCDIAGRVVYAKDIDDNSSTIEVSVLDAIPPGTYVLTVILAYGSVENTKVMLR